MVLSRQVDRETVELFEREEGVEVIETSVKDDVNVKKCFDRLVDN